MVMRWPLGNVWKRLADVRQQHGLAGTVQLLVDRLGKRMCRLAVNRIVWLDRQAVAATQPPPDYEFRFLSADEIAAYAADRANDLDDWLVERGRGSHDRCFAALREGRLAAYGWYALKSIEPEHLFGVGMSYPDDVAYMYAGFTHPDFRGQRLHGYVMALALLELEAWGVRRLVSYVDWTNWPSLKSCQRLGYEQLGPMISGQLGPWRFERVPRAALERGVRFGRQADHSARQATADESTAVAACV